MQNLSSLMQKKEPSQVTLCASRGSIICGQDFELGIEVVLGWNFSSFTYSTLSFSACYLIFNVCVSSCKMRTIAVLTSKASGEN